MNIWPWSRIKELEEQKQKWINDFMDIYKSRQRVLKYLDHIEGGHHTCLRDQLWIFREDGTWSIIDPRDPENGRDI